MLDRERTGALYCVPKLDLLDFEYVVCKVSCNRYRIVCVHNPHGMLACYVPGTRVGSVSICITGY